MALLKNLIPLLTKRVTVAQPWLRNMSGAAAQLRLPADALSEDEAMMRDSVARLAADVVAPRVATMDRESKLDPVVLSALFENGLMGVEVPEEFGGVGGTFFQSILAVEELAKVDPSVSVLVDIHNTLNVTLIKRLGNAQQHQEWLPRIATDTVTSFCLSEAGSGSDAFALRCRADRQGDEFVLNGTKQWISNSMEAGLFIVMANAAPDKGYKGITTFLVDARTPGVSLGKKEDKLGLRASSTCELVLDDVRVPAGNVLGELGMGYRYAIEMLNEGRIGIAAQMVGLAQGCFDHAVRYVRERQQFGQRIWDFQAMQHQIAQVATDITATRTLVYNAARRKEAGLPFVKEAAMAKFMSAEVASRTTSKSIEWMGGVGFTKDYPVEKFYRDVKIGAIYEGTNNIQLNTIAKILDQELQQQ